jgi:hypothetical protein
MMVSPVLGCTYAESFVLSFTSHHDWNSQDLHQTIIKPTSSPTIRPGASSQVRNKCSTGVTYQFYASRLKFRQFHPDTL